MDVNWGEAPHGLDAGLDSWSARMHAALSSHWGCSQVLFLKILSFHVHPITLRLQRVVGATLLPAWRLSDLLLGALSIKKRLLNRWISDENMSKLEIFLIFVVVIRRDSEPGIWMWGLSTRLSRYAGCLLDVITTGDDKTIKILDYLSKTITQYHTFVDLRPSRGAKSFQEILSDDIPQGHPQPIDGGSYWDF